MSNASRKPGSWLFKVFVFFGAIAAAYFINLEVQTRLGENARAATGLTPHSLEDALAQAKTEKKPVLVELSAVWCPSCRALDRNVLSVPEVAKAINAHYVFALIEYESETGEAFLKEHDLSGFPHLMLLKPDGTVQRPLAITYDPVEFLKELMP